MFGTTAPAAASAAIYPCVATPAPCTAPSVPFTGLASLHTLAALFETVPVHMSVCPCFPSTYPASPQPRGRERATARARARTRAGTDPGHDQNPHMVLVNAHSFSTTLPLIEALRSSVRKPPEAKGLSANMDMTGREKVYGEREWTNDPCERHCGPSTLHPCTAECVPLPPLHFEPVPQPSTLDPKPRAL